MSTDLDLSGLSHAEKDTLILTLSVRLDEGLKLIAALRARIEELTRPGKTPGNSSMPPSKGQKSNMVDKPKRTGPRAGSIGQRGGGRELTAEPDEMVIARAARCQHCNAALTEAGQHLAGRYNKIDLPRVRPVVTLAERYAGCAGAAAPPPWQALPEGLEPGTPFSVNIVAQAM